MSFAKNLAILPGEILTTIDLNSVCAVVLALMSVADGRFRVWLAGFNPPS
jgi:hypothetical protein